MGLCASDKNHNEEDAPVRALSKPARKVEENKPAKKINEAVAASAIPVDSTKPIVATKNPDPAPAYPPQDESKSNSGPKVRQGQEKTQRQAHEAQADPRTGENTCSPPLQKQPAEGVAPLRDLVVNTCTASDSYDGARPGTGKGHADEAKAEAAENPSSEPKNHQTRGSKVSRDAMGRDSTRPGGMAADAKANPTTGEISESSKRRSEERNAINEALDMLESDDETPMPKKEEEKEEESTKPFSYLY